MGVVGWERDPREARQRRPWPMDWSRVDRPPVDEMGPLKEDTLVYGSAWKRGERREIIKEDVVPRRERETTHSLSLVPLSQFRWRFGVAGPPNGDGDGTYQDSTRHKIDMI